MSRRLYQYRHLPSEYIHSKPDAMLSPGYMPAGGNAAGLLTDTFTEPVLNYMSDLLTKIISTISSTGISLPSAITTH